MIRSALKPTQLDAIKSYDGKLPPEAVAESFDLQPYDVISIWKGDWDDSTRNKIGHTQAQLILGAHGRLTANELAAEFHCSPATIYNIWSGDSHLGLERTERDVLRSDGWKYRLLALMIEQPYRPSELADRVGRSLNSIHREMDKMRDNGWDIRVTCGSRKNERYYSVDNAKLTRPLVFDVRNN